MIWYPIWQYACWALAILYPILQIGFLRRREKLAYGQPLHLFFPFLGRTLLFGIFIGVCLSLLFSFYSVYFPFSYYDILLIWSAILFLSFWGLRFVCLVYAVFLCGCIQGLADFFSNWLGEWTQIFRMFSLSDWLWLVALLHLGEAFLIRFDGQIGKQIMTIDHVQYTHVNGFTLFRIWPIPLVLPTIGGPLIFPILLSFCDRSFSQSLSQQQRRVGSLTFLYANLLIALLIASSFYSFFVWIALGVAFIGHEGLYHWQKYRERGAEPYYQTTEKGLTILDVVPGSPAAEMGLKTGDRLQRINRQSITSTEEICAITEQSTYCKLELVDEEGYFHMLHRAIYEGDPRDLGIIGAVATNPISLAPSQTGESVKKVK